MTGPGSAFSGTVYAYADASDALSTFSLDKTFPTGANVYGIKFQYHMYGAAMGVAKLESSADGTNWLLMWTETGDKGDQWLQATAYTLGNSQSMLKFTYTSEAVDTGDFALDDIHVGDCLVTDCAPSPNHPCIQPGGTCDAATGRCTLMPDGHSCDDGHSHTGTNGICYAGECVGCPPPAFPQCEGAGTFDLTTLACSAAVPTNQGGSCTSGTSTFSTCDNGACSGIAAHTTSFEAGADGWVPTGTRPFYLSSGSTGSFGTGPQSAHDGSYYAYAETSGWYTTEFIALKDFGAGNFIYGVSFAYNMYGATIGTATLESSADGTNWSPMWTKSGDLGDSSWYTATVFATAPNATALRMRYISGASFTGDFAFDDVKVGDCLTVGCTSCTVCDSNTGMCAALPDGTVCDDNDPLTTNDMCTSGYCMGVGFPSPAPTTSAPTPFAPCYTLNMYDSWGDGWNGHQWTWNASGSDAVYGTLSTGIYGTARLCQDYSATPQCAHISVDFLNFGYPYEVSWDLEDSSGTILASGGAGSGPFAVGPCGAPTAAPTASECGTAGDGAPCSRYGLIVQGTCQNSACVGIFAGSFGFGQRPVRQTGLSHDTKPYHQ